MNDKAHVFISYSRRNIEFAQRLHAGLNQEERELWVDWEDIPRAADWMQEIYSGIDTSDTFLFLVSPDSLISEVCNQELAYAFSKNKKIIPLILKQIDDANYQRIDEYWQTTNWTKTARDNWTALKHLNWLFFDDDSKYDSEFSILMKTIDQDLYHLKTHTRILVRAQEWLSANKNPSSCLRGDDLVSAEYWLQNYTMTEPLPTQLHRDYVQASRDVENERLAAEARLQASARQRLQILVASFVIIILVIAFVLLPIINNILRNNLANDIDNRLDSAVFSAEELLLADEDLAVASARFVANLTVWDGIRGNENAVAGEIDRVRTDFGLQEISFYGWSFSSGDDPIYYLGPDSERNARVRQEREDLILWALNTNTTTSRIIIGSPESQIVAVEPVYEIKNNPDSRVLGAVLVAFDLNDAYLEDIATVLNLEIVLANLEQAVVATTLDNTAELQTIFRELDEQYNFYNDDNDIFTSFEFINSNGVNLQMITTPFTIADEEIGFIFLGDSFEAVLDVQEQIGRLVFIFSSVISGVVVLLLLVLVGIPAWRNRNQAST